LNFDGNCRQAMKFYQRCLGGELTISTFPDASGQPSTDPAAKVMHAQLSMQGSPALMASDTPAQGSLQRGNNFSVALDCDSRDEIERLFSALSEKGHVTMPLADAPWGAVFGMLTDQFGIQWLFNWFMPQPAA
jgi:PhnB protein